MNTEKTAAFLEELKANPKAAELLAGREQPKNEDEKAQAYLDVAKALGFDLTAEDLTAYWKKLAEARREKTEAQAAEIEKLDDSEIEKIAGGKVNKEDYKDCESSYYLPGCEDTFQQRENCWFNDGCDNAINSYDNYLCAQYNEDANAFKEIYDMTVCLFVLRHP